MLIPVDGEEHGAPAKPRLPEAGDVTITDVTPGVFDTGEHDMGLLLHNHTSERRPVYVHVDTPGWGSGREHELAPAAEIDMRVPYTIRGDWRDYVDGQERGCVRVSAIQLPMNMNDLDIAEERFFCRFQYSAAVDEAHLIDRTFAFNAG